MYRYFQNPFMAVTVNNFKKMLLMGRDHCDKLRNYLSDPDIQNLYNSLSVAFANFEKNYTKVNSIASIYKGNTQKVETLMQELMNTKAKQWDIWIQNVYIDGTPEYTMLFAQGRKPFHKGAYELRIDAISTLNTTLANFPNLANVQTDVQDFLNKINDARSTQQLMETKEQELRLILEESRKELALEMHAVFGFLLYKHHRNPATMSQYYEIKYLQAPTHSKALVISKYNIAAASRITLFDGVLTENSFITLKNTGTTALKVFASNDANAMIPEDVFELAVAETYTFYVTELSDGLGYNWLVVVNDSSSEGKLEAGKEDIQPE